MSNISCPLLQCGLEKRPGLSELTAVIVLCAITLIAGILLYELVFSGQGAATQNAASEAQSVVNSAGGNPANQYYTSAQVSASVTSCDSSTGVCTIQLTNTGSANTEAIGCTFSGSGAGTLSPNPSELAEGTTSQVTCATSSGQGSASGGQVTGMILLSNGASVDWIGNWS